MSDAIQSGYHSLTLLFALNWDRIVYVTAISVALVLGAFAGHVLG
ncbi:hypothetical protein [Pseudooceanicola nanhaiensis]|jgi:hypothetical protein|uniref:Uncharacterized protein n=1 Tax=Pseudooceanicola nanhaiensis TaxID=375761 RepID=A0A917SNJ5_9RHOB|nr:hypothetical protein [Pseudooceanicola nanhaiensis]GGL88509.1 hypothetical protein GCM10011534_08210 [Pseudooceanicola nanhaiensis]